MRSVIKKYSKQGYTREEIISCIKEVADTYSLSMQETSEIISNKKPFYGEIACQKPGCKNKAYYCSKTKKGYFCGVHCKCDRITLKKDPNAKQKLQEKYDMQLQEIKEIAKENRKNKRKGDVIMYKMRMMRNPEYVKGYLKVFPNFKHSNRKDGLGMSSLSPKSMGPIPNYVRKSPKGKDVPVCKTLEAFHQAAKVFPSEVDSQGNPTEEWYETRKEMYAEDEPRRHKTAAITKGNRNIPLYSIWVDKNGKEKRFTYFESRQFYCNIYERFALKDPNFKKLQDLLTKGTNLMICGYDAYPVDKSPEEMYKDTSKPFGHEMVLYVMLTFPEEKWPWRKYKTEDF